MPDDEQPLASPGAEPSADAGPPIASLGSAPAGSGAASPDTDAGPPIASSGSAPAGWGAASPSPDASGAPSPTAAPPRRRGLGRKIVVPAIVIGVIVVGLIARPYLTGSAADLKAGDCFDDPIAASQGGEVKDVQHRPCTDLHLYEVLDTFRFPADDSAPFPGSSAFSSFIDDKCSAAFLAYVGIATADSTLGYEAYVPVADGWQKGDREVTCFLGLPGGSKLTGSMRGAKR